MKQLAERSATKNENTHIHKEKPRKYQVDLYRICTTGSTEHTYVDD